MSELYFLDIFYVKLLILLYDKFYLISQKNTYGKNTNSITFPSEMKHFIDKFELYYLNTNYITDP